MKAINETLSRVDKPARTLPSHEFSPPSPEEAEGIGRHQTKHSVYRWMLSDLQNRTAFTDAEVATALDMDAGYFSRVMHGTASFTWDTELRFMSLCGRGDPVYWECLQMGLNPSTIRPVESIAERQLRETKEENARLKVELAAVAKALRGEYGQ